MTAFWIILALLLAYALLSEERRRTRIALMAAAIWAEPSCDSMTQAINVALKIDSLIDDAMDDFDNLKEKKT